MPGSGGSCGKITTPSRGVSLFVTQLNEYEPGTAFTGVIGRTPDVSWPALCSPTRVCLLTVRNHHAYTVTVGVSGELIVDDEAAVRMLLADQ